MNWTKLGKIFCAEGQNASMVSGGRTPVPLHLCDDIFRIYFASYDSQGRGRVFFLETDIKKPTNILRLCTEPVLDLGAVGFYDDNGIIPSDILSVEGKLFLYTIGFSLKNRVIFDAASGFALSSDGGHSFQKFPGTIIDRSWDDPSWAASPTVLKEGNRWRMWYVSCSHWEPLPQGGYRHFYTICHRESSDGIHWPPPVTTCIDHADEHEYAISRPSVIRDKKGLYRMWYSSRERPGITTYRIGYAESADGLHWKRLDDQVGIDISPHGWDSEMICYPYVFEHDGRLYMLYNGNHYGATGFGLAVLEED